MDLTQIETIAKTHYIKKLDKNAKYGTAGFRMKADVLDYIVYRMGILVVLRAKVRHAVIGLMVTASHNPEEDNGVKIIDPSGEMLEASWETIATNLANANDNDLPNMIQNIITEQSINMSAEAIVVVGRDTRRSSPMLLEAALAGIRVLGGTVRDFGVVTTPQLHYLVVCINTNSAYGEPTHKGYYTKLSSAFKGIRGNQTNKAKYIAELHMDVANGVGGVAMLQFEPLLSDAISMNIFNNGSGQLNSMCGADYVKTKQMPPINYPQRANTRCCSFDGDADRVVYYYTDDMGKFHLLDGDRIATLVATYFKELLEASQLSLDLGLVQTAYANGESTSYISNVLRVPVVCASTGVKHLHHKALQFDIGIYFEANGHGTVIFKESAEKIIRESVTDNTRSASAKEAASKLSTVIDLINQTVGDAISDMLLVETILHAKGWSAADWKGTYKDLSNRQAKVKVQDRHIITTTDVDRCCVTPVGLQDEIDKVVASYQRGRSFIRPSGTEDVVRVYVECENPLDVDRMAFEVSLLVYRMAGGIGPVPVLAE